MEMINYYEQKELWDRDLTPQEAERIDLVKKIIPEDVVTILDVGCGNGALTNGLEGYDITGLDKSVEALKYYKHKKQHGSIDELPFEDNSFDFLICSDVLEHLDANAFISAINELKRVSKKYILIISPNEEDLAANFVKCHTCSHIFNINLHERSLGFNDLVSLFSSDFVNLLYTYFGDKWANEPEVKYKFKRAYNKGYKSWEHSVCPCCGTKQKTITDKSDPATDIVVNPHVMGYYNHSTEVMILFCDAAQSGEFYNNNIEDSKIVVLNDSANKDITFIHRQYIDCRKPLIKQYAEAYPQIAYLLNTDRDSWSSADGQTVLKIGENNNFAQVYFPAEEGMKFLHLKVKFETYSKVNVNVYDAIDSYRRLGVISNTELDNFVEYRFELPSDLVLPNEGLIIEFAVATGKGEIRLVFDKLYIDHDLYSVKCEKDFKSNVFGKKMIGHVVGDKIHISSGYYADLGLDDYLLIDGNLYWNVSNSFEVFNKNKPIHDKDYFFYRLIGHYDESFRELEAKLAGAFKAREDDSVDYAKYMQSNTEILQKMTAFRSDVSQSMGEFENSLSSIRANVEQFENAISAIKASTLDADSKMQNNLDSAVKQFEDTLSKMQANIIDADSKIKDKLETVEHQVESKINSVNRKLAWLEEAYSNVLISEESYDQLRSQIFTISNNLQNAISAIKASTLDADSKMQNNLDSAVKQFEDTLSKMQANIIDADSKIKDKLETVEHQVESKINSVNRKLAWLEEAYSNVLISEESYDQLRSQIFTISNNLQNAIDNKAVFNYRIGLVDEQLKDAQQYYEKIPDVEKQIYELQSQVYTLSNTLQQSIDNRSILSYDMSVISDRFKNTACKIKSKLSRFVKKTISATRQMKVVALAQRTHVDTSMKHLLILTPDVRIDRRTVQMCESMIKEFGIRCTIIAALEADDDFVSDNLIVKRISPYDICGDGGTDCSWQASKCFDLEKFYWLHSKYLTKALEEQADYVMCCDLPVLPCAVHVAKHMGVPLIYDAHELYPEQACFSDEQRSLYKSIEKYYIGLPDLVITVNDSIAIEMGERYGIEKPSVILNAIDAPQNFDVDRKYDYFREQLPIRSDQKIVLFQGGYSPNRNLELFVRSARHIKDSSVVLVLMGFGDFGAELEKIAKEDKTINEKVFFFPAVEQSVLLEYSASADVGIIPYPHVDLNSYYCTPNKLFEFIQAGLPIIANDSPELNRFVKENNIGYSGTILSEEDIASLIDEYFEQNIDYKDNIKEVRPKINWQTEEKKFIRVIKELL
ncbi:MAG: methyltransferase domain-containing protein [Deferribacterales bacterium]